VQREELGAMRAALAHEQHQPVVSSGDVAMGAAKSPRCIYDRGRHSNLRLEDTMLAKFIIGSAAKAIGVPPMRTEKTQWCAAAFLAPLTVLSSHHRMGFRAASGV
jgi:hypothetical protein